MDVVKKHKSHISSSEANSRGWSRVPSPAVQRETRKQEVGTCYMNYVSLGPNECVSGSTTTSSVDCYVSGGTGVSGDWYYYPYQTWGDAWYDSGTHYGDNIASPQPTTIIREIIKEKEVTKMEQRTLFKVYVVDPKKNGKILCDGKLVIAVNENQAMLKAGVADIADKEGLDLEQVDVYVQTIGTFIRPRKDTQRVKVVKEDD